MMSALAMNDFKFFRDTDGAPRAAANDPSLSNLATFLESDIRENRHVCIDLLGDIISTRKGEKPYEFIGNGWILSYSPEFAAIACHAAENDDVTPLPPEKIALALKDWLEFID